MDLLLKEKTAALRSSGGRGGEGHAPEGAAGHAQDRVDALVHKAMVHQVHVVGEGVIGQAALTGAHRWILHDSLDECGEADEVLLEMNDQFCAGIHLFLIHGLDHLLRLASIQIVIHPNFGSLDCRVTLFFLAALEVIRRGHWNFYRLENEHLNNAEKFRSVKVIPWYYAIMRNWEITTTYPGTDTLQAAKMFWNSIPRNMAQLLEVYHVLNDISEIASGRKVIGSP